MAEAIAGIYALQFGRDLSLHHIILKWDGLSVIKSCSFSNLDRYPSSLFASEAAHLLAKEAMHVISDRFWVDEAPPFLLSKLNRDSVLHLSFR
ncbi:hypothetical protein Gogos_019966 [Gossypium gossypioides]|uniref:RNase H type-1 domain-containing protein n=1 Tax=Gossypium gossypioides TaxID=34282 RepID=A0A7J9D669_GOSGO|nr:hypothetical protein [Gossypium gossypioides]